MRNRVVLASGNQRIDSLLQTILEERNIFVTACVREEAAIRPMVEGTQSDLIVLSSYLIWREDPAEMRKAVIDTLLSIRNAGARSILLCPDRECLIDAVQKGFTDIVIVENNSIQVEQILEVIDNPLSIQDAHQQLGIIQSISSFQSSPSPQQTDIAKTTLMTASVAPKSVGFWSIKSGIGVGTFLRSVAVEVAARGYRTGFIETDLLRPASTTALGLSHPERNLEGWVDKNSDSEIDGAFSSIQPYLLNQQIWLQQNLSASKELVTSVKGLPEELYVLAPSNALTPWKVKNHPLPEMPKHIFDEMRGLGFRVILADIPSEINYPTTIATMKEVDEVYVMLGPNAVDMVHTQRALEFLKPELGNKFKIIFNQYEERHKDLIKGIEKMLGQKFELLIPRCDEVDVRAFDLLTGGGAEYQQKVREFCDMLGFVDTNLPQEQKVRSRFGERISRFTHYLSGGA